MSARGRGIGFDAAEAAARALRVSPAALAGPEGVAAAGRLLDGLDVTEVAALRALVDLGGAASVLLAVDEISDELAAAPGAAPAASKKGATALLETRRLVEQSLISLWESGVVARDRASRTFFLVPDLGAALLPGLRQRLVDSLPVADPAESAIDEHLLICTINVVRHEPIKLTREDVPFKRSLETLADRLKATLARKDPLGHVDLLIATLVDLDMLERRGDTLEIAHDAAKDWAHSGLERREDRILAADPTGLAAFVLAQWRDVAANRAWPEGALVRLIRRQVLAVGTTPQPGVPEVNAAIAAALSTLERAGLVGRVDASLVLTAAGRGLPPPPETQVATFHVGADLAVLVPRGLDAMTHLELGAIARLESADVVARYRLEQVLVLDALDRGATPASIEALLDRATPALPASVREDVRRWCARFGEVTSYQGMLVTCGPVERHAEFAALVSRSGLAVILVGPGLALVEPNDHGPLCLALAASGFSPRRTILSPRGALRPKALPLPRPPVPVGAAIGARAPVQAQPWTARVDAGAGLQATPPPGAFVARLKEKYRREFGGAQVAALDGLELDELLALEERGGIRGFLAGKAPGSAVPLPRLEEFTKDEMVSVSPLRARQILEQAMVAGLRCQVGHATRPGHSAKLFILPLEVIADATGTWLRARIVGGRERMLAIDRIHAVRVMTT